MKPRVGHIVWYRTSAWENGPLTDYAAIVIRLQNETTVDLAVFDPNSMIDNPAKREVPHDPTGSTPGTWRWPVDE